MGGIGFDRVVDVYDATRSLPPPLMERAIAVLADVIGGDGPVLEVGVGTGRFAAPLRARGIRIVGVDIAAKMLARAREKGCEDLVLGTVTRLPFRDGAFRASLAIHVLHLVAAWRDALRELARVTRGPFLTVLETITTRALDSEEAHAGAGPGDAYHPSRRYLEIARTRGFEYEHPGVRPPEMIARVPPDLRIPLGRHGEHVSGEALLAPAGTKSYSFQWNVPDDLHAAVMEQLTREMAGRTFERAWEIEVLGWSAAALRGF